MLADRDKLIRVERYDGNGWTWAATADNGERSGGIGFWFHWTARRAARRWLDAVRKGWA